MLRRLGLGKNNHLTYASLALNPRIVLSLFVAIFSSLRKAVLRDCCISCGFFGFFFFHSYFFICAFSQCLVPALSMLGKISADDTLKYFIYFYLFIYLFITYLFIFILFYFILRKNVLTFHANCLLV